MATYGIIVETIIQGGSMLKVIPEFMGRYCVNELGEIFSMVSKGNIQLSPVCKLKPADNKGYKRVALRYRGDSTSYNKYVHRLVAEMFISNPGKLSDVNHKDGNKSNNVVSNLEWCSRQHNVTHAWETGLSTSEMLKFKGMTTYYGTSLTNGTMVEVKGKQALKDAGYDPTNVIRVCNGERGSHKGMTWTKIKSSDIR